jgi:DNA-binding SARP family transcriptional activator
MSLAIHMLGRPHLERDGEPVATPRGHKAWGLVAYLLLSRVRNPSREHLAELLFTGADDPLGSRAGTWRSFAGHWAQPRCPTAPQS